MTARILSGFIGRLLPVFTSLFFFSSFVFAQDCSLINFNANSTKICAPDSAVFQATNLPAGSSCYWFLGSGPFLPGGPTASKIYVTPGAYTISLIVKLADGTFCDTIIRKDYINVFQAPIPVLDVSPNTILCNGPGSVIFTDNTPGSIASTWAVEGYPYSAKSFTHVFNTYGNKDVTLSVKDANGCISSVTKIGLIKIVRPPEIDFCLTATVTEQEIIASMNSVINSHGSSFTSYVWNFPGGNPSSSTLPVPPVITYSDVTKKYDVSLTVTNAEGCIYTLHRSEYIQKFLLFSKDSICLTEKVLVTNLANNNGRVNFSMDSYGSKSEAGAGGIVKLGYSDPGDYDLLLKFNYGTGKCDNSISFPKYINVKGPKVKFTTPDWLGCDVPFTVRLQNQSIVTGGINTFFWHITDPDGLAPAGTPIFANGVRDTTVVLTKKGEYDIKLVCISSNGCSDSVNELKYIRIQKPIADFYTKDTLVCAGQKISIIDLVTPVDHPNSPYIYNWIFTNADSASISITANGKSPVVILTVPGRYHVMLIVKSGNSCADTLSKNYYIRVKGIVAELITTGSTGCIPFTTQATAKVLLNVPPTPQNTISYQWYVNPADGVTISNPDSASTSFTFSKSNCYDITLTLTNTDGCFLEILKKKAVCIGVKSNFETDTNFCRNTPIALHDLSSFNPTSFQWLSTPSTGVSFQPSSQDMNPTVTFTRDTIYKISHIVGRMVGNQLCTDTFSRLINVPVLTADFMTFDSLRYCAPLIVNLKNKSVGAINYLWDFDDGTTLESDLPDPSHGYSTNNSSGFNVKMVAINKTGCRDSMNRTIRIIGPTPAFTMSADRFCTEGTVTFKNTSKNSTYFVFDYGDSRNDTNQIFPHTYTFFEQGSDSNIYHVLMLAKDGFCPLSSVFRDTVIVYRPANADFSSDTTRGCPPLTVRFTDLSNSPGSGTWDFNSDGITDDTAKVAVHDFLLPGVYDVKHSYISKYGCKDSIIKPGFIRVNEYPKGDFRLLNTTFCSGAKVFFEAFNTSPGAKIYWDFGDPATSGDTAEGIKANYSYPLPGTYTVSIRLVDLNGCIFNLSKPGLVVIPKTTTPPIPFMKFVTVENNNSVKISWSKMQYSEFQKYELIFTDNGVEYILYSTNNINDTVFIHNSANVKVDQESYKYRLWMENNCGQRTQTILHNSILLKVSTSPASANLLTWTSYQAWSNVLYKIFRSKDGGAFEYIATTSSLLYTDSNICDFDYCYFVEAGMNQSPFTSMSNTSCNHPPYIYQTMPLKLNRTTVIDNSVTGTSWEKSIQRNVKEYVIDRFDHSSGWKNKYAITSDPEYSDASALVNRESYIYRVSVLDKCQNLSPVSNIGTSILLKSQIFEDRVFLTWNSYKEWSNGVGTYELQLRDKQHIFKTINEVAGTDTSYTDAEMHSELDTAFCYRVIAIENSTGPDSSVSNISCSILPSRIFIPSAFTPNDDGLNDVFRISYVSLFNLTGSKMAAFDMKIFDRWGGLIFQTDDYNKGWDGTKNGSPVQIGAYLYIVTALGLDNTRFNLSGTVTLLR